MSSVVGLELPDAWRTGQVQDSNFDISADQLNLTTNRELWLPTGTVNWDTAIHKNALDPVDTQDLATKNYVDINGANLWSTFPAQANVDYVGTYKNINLIEPTNNQDSATKFYVDNNAGAQDLDGLSDVTINTPLDDQFLQYNAGNGQWENVAFVPGTGPAIEAGNSSVTVIDTGTGRVETVIDGVLKVLVEQSLNTYANPFSMSNQQIRDLGTPAQDTDATTKVYVDDLFAQAPTELDELTDVTITSPFINQILVNNGSGQWINQLVTKSQLPSEIAYEDEVNTFTENQVFSVGLQVAPDQTLDMAGGMIHDIKYMDLQEQSSDPPDPALDDARIFFDSAVTFGSEDPLLAVLLNREGVITKKPIVTSETVFALNQFSNGMFTDETGVRLLDNNPTIRVQLFNEVAVGDSYDVVLEGDLHTIDSPDVSVTTANTIDLTEGTDTVPVKHFVWIELQLGAPVMTSNTVGFPDSQDFAAIGTFALQSRTSIFANNVGGNPYAVNSPDYEIKDADIRGHLAHINDRLVELDAAYVDGIVLTSAPLVGGGTAAEVTYSSTAGRAYELHIENIEAFDITDPANIALVENDGNNPGEVTRVVNLSDDLTGMLCGDGVDLMYSSNNDTANLVVFTVHNDNEPNITNYGINLPQTQYSNDDSAAIADTNNYANKNVPLATRGITLLIAEIVVKFTTGGGGLYEVLAVKDLRGQIPGAAGGSGGGSAGATQLNDLTDVTIGSPLVNQNLVNDGAGQWVNILGPQLLTANVWENYQDYDAITAPVAPANGTGRFFVETLDASNDALFIWLNQAGVQTKVRLA